MKTAVAFALCLVAGGAAAQSPSPDWTLLPGDMPLSVDDLGSLTNGGSLTFHDDGISRFSAGGSYSYTYANQGGTAFGTFDIRDDGKICIDFRNGAGCCDLYVRNGLRLILLTENGERFPVKIELGINP
ncbi:MAG: hypothetical protein O2898_09110 [Proteobacteria bacterium]|nr:hypothetical protein [Pseudomonadota bacterium]